MKKTYLALALASLVAAGTAAAADVQIYGRVDAGLRYTSVKHGDDTLKLESGNRAHNRIGFNVTEDIGNGLKAKAYLENGFTLDDGNLDTAGQLFNRRSILALESKTWGEVGFGRMGTVHSTMAPYAIGMAKWDPFGTSYSQASIGSTFANSSRVNNGITWMSPNFSGWKGGVTYSLGDASDETEAYTDRNHTLAAALSYQGQNFFVSTALANITQSHVASVKIGADKDSAKAKSVRQDIKDAQLYGIGGWVRVTPEARIWAAAQWQENFRTGGGISMANLGGSWFKSVEDAEENAPALSEEGVSGYSLLLGTDYVTGQHKVILGAQYFDGEYAGESDLDFQRTVFAAAYEYKLAKTVWFYVAATHSMGHGNAKSLAKENGNYKGDASELMTGFNWNF